MILNSRKFIFPISKIAKAIKYITPILPFILFFGSTKSTAQIGWIPKWSFIADSGSSICSPLVVNDIAIVGSGWENTATSFSVFALSISDGSLIWKKKFNNQIIGVSAPHKGRVIVSGRKAILSCIDYTTGNILWSFNRNSFNHFDDSLRFNFNQPQWVADLNNDGEKDLIAIYAGGSTAKKPFRPAGYLLAIDGVTGNILGSDTMPDGNESYATPLIYNNHIYFGSGGETVGGSFYKVSIANLLIGNIQQAKVIASNANKGFIAAPSIFGETMLIPCLDETIYAYDLNKDSLIFSFTIQGSEIYSSISVIDSNFYFTSQKGKWPFYQGYSINQFDAQGNFLDSSTFPTYHFASPISLTAPNAMLIAENKDLGFTEVSYNHRFRITQRGNLNSTLLATPYIFGIHLFSTPRSAFLLDDGLGNVSVDCENNGFLTVSGFDPKNYYFNNKIVVSYYELPEEFEVDNNANQFGGYLGNLGDGNFHQPPCNISSIDYHEEPISIVFPNPTNHQLNVLSNQNNFQLKLYNQNGVLIETSSASTLNVDELTSGHYILKVIHDSGKIKTHKILISK